MKELEPLKNDLTDIKLSITKLIASVDNHISNCKTNMCNLSAMVQKHDADIHGNGKLGLQREIDAINRSLCLEEKHRNYRWTAVWGILTAISGKLVYDFVSKR